jgi:hypothetical protein
VRYARITAPPVAGGQAPQPFILGDDAIARGPGSRFIVGGWPGWNQLTEDITYLDSAFCRNFAWGNRNTIFSLVCEYEFADESACFLFVCRLPLLCPGAGLLEMGVTGTGGGSVSYPYAVIQSVTPVIGQNDGQVVSTRLRFNIAAGAPALATESPT